MMRRNEVGGRATQAAHLIFVTNFPSGTSTKQLWDVCEQYGKVVDSFIPNRVSKEGKKHAFVRFIKVSNMEVLVGNLNTIWIGKFKLRFNLARFQRAVSTDARHHKSDKLMEDKPMMVIDDDCLTDKISELTLVAKVKTFDSMPNLRIIFKDEGFEYVTIRVDERVFWVDVEGIPSVAWTSKTFMKIAKKWGELVFTEDFDDNNLWRKRLVTVIRAREIIRWIPDFMEKENETSSDSVDEESKKSTPYTDICSGVNGIGRSESDDKGEMNNNNGDVGEVKSDDPFGIYNLLNQKDKHKEGESLVSEDPSKPHGFSKIVVEDNIVSEKEDGQVNINGSLQETFSKPLQASRKVEKEQHSKCNLSSVKGGGGSEKDSALPKGKCPRIASSLLEKMNEFVEIGQAMRFYMDGCVNDIEKLISRKGDGTDLWKELRDLDALKEKDLVQKDKKQLFRGMEPGTRKVSWFSWDSVVASKEVEGLGMSTFFAMNCALLFKWIWRFKVHPKAMWVSIIKAIHRACGNLDRDIMAASNKLPTRFNMSLRGLEVPSIDCPICLEGVETSDHLFFSCPVASSIVAKVLGWWGLPNIVISSYQGWLNWFNGLRLRKEVKDYLEGTMFVSWWIIWNYHNKLIFYSDVPKKASLFDLIVYHSFVWCNARVRRKLEWLGWLKSPMTALL
uniref:RNA-directed DNA polymerase, eukaryota, nucleotide-binding alpha-beta plait domain protein n=1 Tax=Tanacetum cinerariifolium TaxID=118510 RepID=A0A699HL44_TANCI|nr:RNA-directed DNA polymerase, eukaryota, nucleotide-binding alpha-beta plait domain protein [Tanacetum cinerariifolium]